MRLRVCHPHLPLCYRVRLLRLPQLLQFSTVVLELLGTKSAAAAILGA